LKGLIQTNLLSPGLSLSIPLVSGWQVSGKNQCIKKKERKPVTARMYCKSLHEAYLENTPPTTGEREGPSKLVYGSLSDSVDLTVIIYLPLGRLPLPSPVPLACRYLRSLLVRPHQTSSQKLEQPSTPSTLTLWWIEQLPGTQDRGKASTRYRLVFDRKIQSRRPKSC